MPKKIFVGRDKEQQILRATLTSPEAEMIAVMLFLSGILGMVYFTKNKKKYIPTA